MTEKKSISRAVEKFILDEPLLEDFLARNLINQSALARTLIPRVEKEIGQKVKPQAVIMAVKRFAADSKEHIQTKKMREVLGKSTINLKSGIADIAVEKTDGLFSLLEDLTRKVKTHRGEVLSVVEGQTEAAIITEEKYVDDIIKKLPKKSVLKVERNIVDLHLLCPPDFWNAPGIIYFVTKRLALSNINIIDLLTTPTEFSILVRKEDASRAFESISNLIEECKA
ncbi:TPA: hypothetical protein H1005_01195 [archaeon]|uniref:ACT domain-containing protein n=1 Tax=Candidatus Naiadarchaeum limnaeum TaxID=2756139 RepID=A0A832XGN1_9ARCH|nr:hypothetical protein [Candidatus Naiadarchaeales archaeon SRR2090153.bin1042]HIK00384.1 hypothetical protein [Candidatus Naiadarchaeum limnaeum]